jgi:hypothetical protein
VTSLVAALRGRADLDASDYLALDVAPACLARSDRRIRRALAGVRHPLAVAIGRWWGR